MFVIKYGDGCVDDMNELFLDFLQDVYYAEKQGIRGITRLIKAISDPALKEAMTEHKAVSQAQMERLDEVFALIGKKARGKKCAAMDGLLTEATEQMSEGAKGPILDSALLATGQAIDHYEIARYGALHAWAKAMNLDEVAELLEVTLTEEKEADEKLSDIALRLNREAAGTLEEDEDEDDEEDDEDEVIEEEEVVEAPPPPAPPAPRSRRKKA